MKYVVPVPEHTDCSALSGASPMRLSKSKDKITVISEIVSQKQQNLLYLTVGAVNLYICCNYRCF
jgi:hypothetical protein